MWVTGLWASSVAAFRAAPCFYLIISLTALRLLFLREAILDGAASSSPRPCLLLCQCLLVSIHPSTHLAGLRRERPSGARDWARDGATAGAQSDKERQITPLTRTIHHGFISHPSLPPHLHLKYSAPGWQLQEKKKKIVTLFPVLFPFSRNSRCSSNQHALLLRCGENNEEKAQEETAR